MQTNTDYKNRQSQLEQEGLNTFCMKILDSELVIDTDYEPENEGDPIAYRTKDHMFMFVPKMDDPVVRKTLRGDRKIHNQYRYSVEVGMSIGGDHWSPPDYDQVEIARGDSLFECISLAAHYLLDQKIQHINEEIYWDMHYKLEDEFPVEF